MKLAWDSEHRVDRSDGKYHRERSDQNYHSARWTRLSKRYRELHPLCERCKAKGIIKAAECVDHKIPWPHCTDFFDESNLQSLCLQCNMEKGFEDEKNYGNERIRKTKVHKSQRH